jgi:hypothetical protein
LSLANLTQRSAVLSAIKEFDEIGREAFLAKYGFGHAREYFLLYRGQRYDSKAIAGVAYGYQHPSKGPLIPSEFSGGEATVAKRLRSLGFEMSTSGYKDRLPEIWAFCANPKRYRVTDAVKHLDIDYWIIGRSDVRAGDKAIIWQTLDNLGNRGIVGFAEVISDPEVRSDEENQYWINPEDGITIHARVPVRYSLSSGLPLWVDDTARGKFLQSLSVAKAYGGTIFRVSHKEWNQIIEFASVEFSPIEETNAQEMLRYRSRRMSGQGYGLSSKARKVVEDRAMSMAIGYFSKSWEMVKDVSANSSYDLLCIRDQEELRVEVKGTTGDGHSISFTKNEVKEANEPGYALFLVSEINLEEKNEESPTAHGGICRVFYPTSFKSDSLHAISYRYDLDLSEGNVV